jgi:hypothetical protein
MNLTKIGSITTSDTTAPMDARRDLSKKRMSWAEILCGDCRAEKRKTYTQRGRL